MSDGAVDPLGAPLSAAPLWERPKPLKILGRSSAAIPIDPRRSSGPWRADLQGLCALDLRLGAPALGYDPPEHALAATGPRTPERTPWTFPIATLERVESALRSLAEAAYGWPRAHVQIAPSLEELRSSAPDLSPLAWGLCEHPLPDLDVDPRVAAALQLSLAPRPSALCFQGRCPIAIALSTAPLAPSIAPPEAVLDRTMIELCAIEERRRWGRDERASATRALLSAHGGFAHKNVIIVDNSQQKARSWHGLLRDHDSSADAPEVLFLGPGWQPWEIDALSLALDPKETPGEAKADRSRGDTYRVRVASPREADEALDRILALEARVYEPARRDTREKLGLAFEEGGLAILAEHTQTQALVGAMLSAPLQKIHGVRGCDEEPLRETGQLLYAVATTVDPSARGAQLGFRMKAESLRHAAARPELRYICGRMREGATPQMRKINRRLGAQEIVRLEGEYGGDAVALYYRLALRGGD